ncbi:putative CAP-Gly domain-containing linker protein, partial [Naja naja]
MTSVGQPKRKKKTSFYLQGSGLGHCTGIVHYAAKPSRDLQQGILAEVEPGGKPESDPYVWEKIVIASRPANHEHVETERAQSPQQDQQTGKLDRDVLPVRSEDLGHHGSARGAEGEAAAHRTAPGRAGFGKGGGGQGHQP